mgnify:CR=1 FL=1
MVNYSYLHYKFKTEFKTTINPRLFFAPGRINLIGEHTDYNGGHVFPASISYGTYALAAKREGKKIRFYSMNFPEKGVIECDLDNLEYDSKHNWANYPKGMIKFIRESGYDVTAGMDILYYGNILNSAGLSSSASIEIVTGILLKGLFNLEIDSLELVKLGQQVENHYIGVNSGIMDQFSIAMGKKDHAIHLNTQTLEFSYAPIKLLNHSIIIIHTNKQRTLAESKYNKRRKQCEEALEDLQTELQVDSLGDLTPEEFEQNKHLIKSETNRKRAKHAVYENARTLEALKKLKENDLIAFGQLMNGSHQSLKEDYEVTGIELDTIVETAWRQDGVIGARMTGAGFGGCAIAIVRNNCLEEFKKNVHATYLEKVGYEPSFYIASISDGAREITKEVL